MLPLVLMLSGCTSIVGHHSKKTTTTHPDTTVVEVVETCTAAALTAIRVAQASCKPGDAAAEAKPATGAIEGILTGLAGLWVAWWSGLGL